jgi:hypothetical protein
MIRKQKLCISFAHVRPCPTFWPDFSAQARPRIFGPGCPYPGLVQLSCLVQRAGMDRWKHRRVSYPTPRPVVPPVLGKASWTPRKHCFCVSIFVAASKVQRSLPPALPRDLSSHSSLLPNGVQHVCVMLPYRPRGHYVCSVAASLPGLCWAWLWMNIWKLWKKKIYGE